MIVAQFVAVGIGAAVGAWLRWGLSELLASRDAPFPVGTWIANLLGGLLAGMALAWLARHPETAPLWRLALVTGFLGALTTFSAYSAESLALLLRGEWAWAAAHGALHFFGCLAAAAIGYRALAA